MTWEIRWEARAFKELQALDRSARRRILAFFRNRVAVAERPETLAKRLRGPLSGFWRYRVGDYRILCRIEAAEVSVYVLQVGHRREVYR